MLCETYGVYPSAIGWRDGCWDVTIFTPAQIADMTKEFLTSVLSPMSSLDLHKSNGKPYKFVFTTLVTTNDRDNMIRSSITEFGAKTIDIPN